MKRREFCSAGAAGLTSLLVWSCSEPGPSTGPIAITGGLAIDPAGEAFPNSVIVVSGAYLRAIGSQPDFAVPSGSQVWNAKDRFVIPAPVELSQGVLMPRIATLADANVALLKPPEIVEGIVADADELPPELVPDFARAGTIVVPRLASLAESAEPLARGLRHVKALLDGGVRLASFGGRNAITEWQLLVRAGLTPRQVLISTTLHAARVARLADTSGALKAGFLANLWVLRQDPLASVDNLGSVESIMREGVWQRGLGSASRAAIAGVQD